jgi:virulence-associated protein VagC
MTAPLKKRLHQHGGSKALDLPVSFVKKLPTDTVSIEERDDCLIIRPQDGLTTMESDPLFAQFIQSLFLDAMKNPEKLKDLEEVWDEEWENLLEGVSDDEE